MEIAMQFTAENVRVSAFNVAPRAVDGNAINGCLGHFDVTIPGLTLYGARLHRSRSGELVVIGPRTDSNTSRVSGVRINDPELHASIVEAAVRVARVFGVNVNEAERTTEA